MSDTKTQIKEFITTELGVSLDALEETTPLFTSGAIDSFAMIELLAFLEQSLGAQIDIADMNIEQLDTIESIANLVEQ